MVNKRTGKAMLTLTDSQKCALALELKTAAGNPATADGVPVWSVSDENVLEIQPAADGLSATVLAKGPVGVGQVTVKVDADLGAGVREITGLLDVTVIAGEAAVVLVAAGAPEEKTPVTP